MKTEKASQLIWRACGSPEPHDHEAIPIPPRGSGAPCAGCGEPGTHRMSDAISDNFTTTKNASRAWPFGGQDVCRACAFCARTLALRLALSFTTERGVWFVGTRPHPGMPWTRPDALAALLAPPDPPFVALYPQAGIDHGGEANLERAWWPGRPNHERPLSRLQSKHVAIYARVAYSRERYPIQVDDQHDVMVDVPLWTTLRARCEEMLLEMRQGGVGANDARDALCSLRPPPRCPTSLLRSWRAAVQPLQPHAGGMWWRPVFVNLLGMPELVKTVPVPKPVSPSTKAVKTPKKDTPHAAPEKRDRSDHSPAHDQPDPKDPRVPAPSGEAKGIGGRDRGAPLQRSLF